MSQQISEMILITSVKGIPVSPKVSNKPDKLPNDALISPSMSVSMSKSASKSPEKSKSTSPNKPMIQ